MDLQTLIIPLAAGIAALAGGALGFVLARKTAAATLAAAETAAKTLVEAANKESAALTTAAKREADTLRKAAIVDGKDALRNEIEQFDREAREKVEEHREREKKLQQREEDVNRVRQRIEKKEEDLDRRNDDIVRAREKIDAELATLAQKRGDLEKVLEKTAQMTVEEARKELLSRIEERAKLDAAKVAREIEENAKANVQNEVQKILALAVNRYAGEYVAERTVTVVPIPDDQMKGRIIGREGRNIRTFEMITGVDLIVDDTPDHVVISCHNPLRREIARLTLLRLIEDGRIQPGRIEEIYHGVTQNTEKEIRDAGQQAVFDLGLQGLHPELVRIMGMNKFRTSYSQNVLLHSSEVGFICGIMAAELGLDQALARRCGFLHDIGKAIDHEFEGSHQKIGGELCKKFGEVEDVVRAVAEHHDDPPATIFGVLVQAADTLSAARPGARRETVTNYIKRMEDLERIATLHPEVNRAFAVQSGRELRVMLDAERTTDDAAYHIAKSVAAQIEAELTYPGQIKVTVLRELRASAFAK